MEGSALEVIASLLYSLLRSSSNKLSSCGSRFFLGAHSNSCTTLWICCYYDHLKHNPLYFSFARVSLALAMSSPSTKGSWSPVELQLRAT